MKPTAASLGHLQDFMDTTSYKPSQWDGMEHCHMTHDFWGNSGTYLGQYDKNKTMVKFTRVKKTTLNKGGMSSKLARTTNSTKDVSQIRVSDELDILLTTFGPVESTQEATKKVVDQG